MNSLSFGNRLQLRYRHISCKSRETDRVSSLPSNFHSVSFPIGELTLNEAHAPLDKLGDKVEPLKVTDRS